jgi:hypothetical protein
MNIIYLIVQCGMWSAFHSARVTRRFFDGKTALDHYIFYAPPPNPWFKG